MAVNATSGTTVLGAYDNLKELAEVSIFWAIFDDFLKWSTQKMLDKGIVKL